MAHQEEIILGLQIQTDGETVWVNGPRGMLARLTKKAWELSVPPGWLGGLTGKGTWRRFVEDVHGHWGVRIPEHFKPEWA